MRRTALVAIGQVLEESTVRGLNACPLPLITPVSCRGSVVLGYVIVSGPGIGIGETANTRYTRTEHVVDIFPGRLMFMAVTAVY